MKRLEFRYDRLRIVGWLIFSLFIGFAGYLLAWNADALAKDAAERPKLVIILLGLGLLAFAVFLFFSFARQLWMAGLGKAPVVLVLSEEGIEDPHTTLGLIPWGEVQDIWEERSPGQATPSQLCIRVLHPEALTHRGSPGGVVRRGRGDGVHLTVRFTSLSPDIRSACEFLRKVRGEPVRIVSRKHRDG